MVHHLVVAPGRCNIMAGSPWRVVLPHRGGAMEIDPRDRGNGTAAVVCETMANGQVVLVTTEPLDGTSPIRSVYFVAEGDPTTATALVATMMAPNEKVEAWGSLPEAAVKALGLKPGDFTHG